MYSHKSCRQLHIVDEQDQPGRCLTKPCMKAVIRNGLCSVRKRKRTLVDKVIKEKNGDRRLKVRTLVSVTR